jgi:hypothetical protein
VLSAPGKLEGLFAEAGLSILESNEVDCPFSYPDFATFWRATSAVGPFQGIMKALGEAQLKAALRNAVEPSRLDDGAILIQRINRRPRWSSL